MLKGMHKERGEYSLLLADVDQEDGCQNGLTEPKVPGRSSIHLGLHCSDNLECLPNTDVRDLPLASQRPEAKVSGSVPQAFVCIARS